MLTYGQTIKQYGTETGPTGGFGKLYIILTGSYTGNLISILLKVTDFIINKCIPYLFLSIIHFYSVKSYKSPNVLLHVCNKFITMSRLIANRKQTANPSIADSFKFVMVKFWIALIVQVRYDLIS